MYDWRLTLDTPSDSDDDMDFSFEDDIDLGTDSIFNMDDCAISDGHSLSQGSSAVPSPDSGTVSTAAAQVTHPPAAFSEAAHIRLVYLQTVVVNALKGRTVINANEQLPDSLDLLALVDSLPTVPKPATALVTTRGRLGLDVDKFIERRPICTLCFKHFPMEVIEKMERATCTERGCKGMVWCYEKYKKGSTVTKWRIPIKLQPYSSPITSLRRLLA